MQQSIPSPYFPTNFPMNMSGKLTYKVVQKKDYVRADGTAALYLQVFVNGEKKKIPLNIAVKPSEFNDIKQRIKGSSQLAKDYNLIIGKKIADINNIAVTYRLSGNFLTLEKLLEDLNNPTAKVDFLVFWKEELEKQEGILKKGSYKQQWSTLSKLKTFKPQILFQDINEDLLTEFKAFCKKELKNKDTTIQTAVKNLKKFLHIANKKGIRTQLDYSDISVKSFKGDRTFLDETEIKLLYKYYNSEFASDTSKNILDRFLFACFTGLRISDVQNLTPDNFIGDFLVFKSKKTGKFQKIKLNDAAKKFVNPNSGKVFKGEYTDQYINKHLKFIAKAVKLKKHLTFHVARHSFATNYLIKGGRVENLQKLLGHSAIKETMVYVHIVDSVMNTEIDNMSDML